MKKTATKTTPRDLKLSACLGRLRAPLDAQLVAIRLAYGAEPLESVERALRKSGVDVAAGVRYLIAERLVTRGDALLVLRPMEEVGQR